MGICFNCGSEIKDDTRICGNCGQTIMTELPSCTTFELATGKNAEKTTREQSVKNTGLEIASDAPPVVQPRKNVPLTGLGYSSVTLTQADSHATDARKSEKDKQKKKEVREPFLKDVVSIQAGEEKSTAGKDAPPVSRSRELDGRRSRIVLIAAILLLIPGMALPWFYILDCRPLEAFRLPLLFLFVETPALPWLTAGVLLAAFFFPAFILSMMNRPPITLIQVGGLFCIILASGTVLLGLRQWNAMAGLGPQYPHYIYQQMANLPETRIFGIVETGPPSNDETLDFAGKGAGSSLAFLLRVLGPGAVFPFLSGILILWAGLRYGYHYAPFRLSIPAAIAALAAAALMFCGIFFIISRAAPAFWYSTRASIFIQMNKTERAERILLKCTQLPVPTGACETTLAGIYWKSGRVKPARELLLRVSNGKPGFPDGHRLLGDLYFAEKNYWQAAEKFRIYLKLAPHDSAYAKKLSDSVIYIGTENYAARRFDAALENFIEAYKLTASNRTDTALLYKIADCYYQTGNKDRALEFFKATADLTPHDFELQIQVAKVYEEIRDYENAIAYYDKSIQAKPDNSLSYVYIGNIYRDAMDDKEAAAGWYTKAIEADEFSKGADTARANLKKL